MKMNIAATIHAYELLESLVTNGTRLKNLPLPAERVESIISLREPPTRTELALLRSAMARANAVVDF
jgi:hypothetical protein